MRPKLPPVLPKGDFVPPADLSNTDDPRVRYTRSYLLIRIVVGLLGLALPIAFIIGEAFIARGVHFRGSISAYYHSPMRDIFVGGLWVIAFLLIMYLAGAQGKDRRLDRPLSTWAGVFLLAVVLFPTGRPGIPEGTPLCGDTPDPLPQCSTLQNELGETPVAAIHFVAAGLFVLTLAAICFYWAARDVEKRAEKAEDRGDAVNRRVLWISGRARIHTICGTLILLGLVLAPLGFEVQGLTSLYLGEIIAVWSFGFAWLFSAGDLWKELLPAAARPKPATATPT
jgi:hypothetical protein